MTYRAIGPVGTKTPQFCCLDPAIARVFGILGIGGIILIRFLATGFVYILLSSSMQAWAVDLPTAKGSPYRGSTVPSISVDGEAVDQVKPDLAILSVEALAEKPTAAAAAAENTKVSNNLVATIEKLGIDAQDISAENLELKPLFRERTDPKTNEVVEHIFTGYRAFTMYRVRIRNVDDAPRIARQVLENGTNLYRGLTFLVSDREARFDTLRAKAMGNAVQRAALYASSTSLKLGDIIQIAPGGGSFPGHSDEDLPKGKEDAAQVELSVPAAPKLDVLRARVIVTWELTPQSATACDAEKDKK